MDSLTSKLMQWFTLRRVVLGVLLVLLGVLLVLTFNYCVFWSPADTDYLFGDEPLVVAHRGASGLAPENTLASFQEALDLGVDVLEMDVHLSKTVRSSSSMMTLLIGPPTEREK